MGKSPLSNMKPHYTATAIKSVITVEEKTHKLMEQNRDPKCRHTNMPIF